MWYRHVIARLFFFTVVACVNIGSGMEVASTSSSGEQKPFPATAYVISEAATIHCAPSLDQYVCDRLTRGQRVEVHKREGDWYAIRPTNHCFSWVGAEYVKLSEDGKTASISTAQAKIWVGGLDAVQQHHSQLNARRGEKLHVLSGQVGSNPTSSPAQPPKGWLKIAPPAGEFRWIHEKLVHMRRTSLQSGATGDPSDDESWVGRKSLKRTSSAVRSREPPVTESILRLRIAVARTMSLPVEEWDLEPLRLAADHIRERSESTWQRGQLARLDRSIEEIASVMEEHRDLAFDRRHPPKALDEEHLVRVAEPIQLTSTERSRKSPRNATESGGRDNVEQRDVEQRETFRAHYDAVGRIMPIHTKKTRTPPYGLVDKDGRLLMLLTPRPGFNIRRYVGQRVGVVGSFQSIELTGRDYEHLLAERIIVLDRSPSRLPSNLAKLPWIVR